MTTNYEIQVKTNDAARWTVARTGTDLARMADLAAEMDNGSLAAVRLVEVDADANDVAVIDPMTGEWVKDLREE